MDTRAKIISTEAALSIACRLKQQRRKLVVVTGSFDVLLAGHGRDLENVRIGTGADALLVVLLPPSLPLLSDRARAEMVASLRVVDYVVTAEESSIGELRSRLPADLVISRQAADEQEVRLLMEHVRSRHSL